MHIRDKGLEDWTATAILALIGLFNVFGTLSSGYLATRISKKKLLSAIYLLRGVSLIYFIFMPPSTINALIFGITFGYLWLATVPPTSGIVGHIFGTKYMMFMNNELLRNFLRSRKIPIREAITITSNMSLDQINNSIEFPVIVRPPKKRVVVNNPTTLKDVVSLYKYGTPIVIERPIKAEMDTWIFVVGDEVVASYKKYQKKLNRIGSDVVVGSDLNKLAVRIRKEIGCDYCAIRFLFADGEWFVDKITLCPDFANFQKMTGVNVARYVISHMARKITEKEKSWFKKVEKFFKLEIPHIPKPHIPKPHIPSIPSIPKPSMPKFPKIGIFGEDKDEEKEQSEEEGKK